MRTPVRLAVACAAAVSGVLAVACGGSSEPGAALYVNLGCPRCHGADRGGGSSAPPLTGLHHTWSSNEALVSYLKQPRAADDPRLKALADAYAFEMPAVRAVADADLEVLADWLRRP